MKAYTPNGDPIIGTLERIQGVAGTIPDRFSRDENGKVSYEHDGDTKVFWDTAETEVRDNEVLFLDEWGGEWPASELVLKEE